MDEQALKEVFSFGNKDLATIWMISGGKVLPHGILCRSCCMNQPDNLGNLICPPLSAHMI